MRLIAVSDIHGRKGNLFDIVEKHIDDADYFLCLGDCNSGDDLDEIHIYFKNKIHLITVCGNTDWRSTEPAVREFTLAGKRIMLCHGHTFNVKLTYITLAHEAKNRGIDIALFGHTHVPYISNENGIYLMNPGSVANGCYGIIDIKNNEIICENTKIQGV